MLNTHKQPTSNIYCHTPAGQTMLFTSLVYHWFRSFICFISLAYQPKPIQKSRFVIGSLAGYNHIPRDLSKTSVCHWHTHNLCRSRGWVAGVHLLLWASSHPHIHIHILNTSFPLHGSSTLQQEERLVPWVTAKTLRGANNATLGLFTTTLPQANSCGHNVL